MSQFPSVLLQDAIVSFSTYIRLSRNAISSIEDIPLRHFLIKLSPNISPDVEDEILSKLNLLKIVEPELIIWDYRLKCLV